MDLLKQMIGLFWNDDKSCHDGYAGHQLSKGAVRLDVAEPAHVAFSQFARDGNLLRKTK